MLKNSFFVPHHFTFITNNVIVVVLTEALLGNLLVAVSFENTTDNLSVFAKTALWPSAKTVQCALWWEKEHYSEQTKLDLEQHELKEACSSILVKTKRNIQDVVAEHSCWFWNESFVRHHVIKDSSCNIRVHESMRGQKNFRDCLSVRALGKGPSVWVKTNSSSRVVELGCGHLFQKRTTMPSIGVIQLVKHHFRHRCKIMFIQRASEQQAQRKGFGTSDGVASVIAMIQPERHRSFD